MSRKYWTSKDVDYLKREYGRSDIKKLANIFGVSYAALVNKAHKLGLNSKAASGELWTKEEDDLLKQHFEYAPKHLLEEKFPNRSWCAILQRGIKTLELNRICQDKYKVNYRFFEKWTPESAYVFGFIAADGYIHYGDKNYLQIEVAAYDRDILEKIKQVMQFEGPILESNRNTVRLQINNKKIISDLIAKGIPAVNKTTELVYPKTLPNELSRHFIRGYCDGDGSIYDHGRHGRLQLLGTKALLAEIKHITKVNNKVGYRGNSGANIYVLAVGGKKGQDIMHWLYEDATIYLDRKYKKYFELTKKEA